MNSLRLKTKSRRNRMMLEVVNPENHDTFGKELVWTSIRHASPKWDGTRCPEEILWHPLSTSTHVANALWKPLVIRLKAKFRNNVMICCKVLSVMGVIVYGQATECHSWEGNFISFDKIPVSALKLDENNEDFKRFLTYPCLRWFLESRVALRITHRYVSSPGISYKLWD